MSTDTSASMTPSGRDPERLGLGASTPDIPESGSPSLGPSEGSTGKPGSGSAPKAPLSIQPNPYGHRCGGVPTKAIIDCAGCAYERGVAEGFKAGYEAEK